MRLLITATFLLATALAIPHSHNHKRSPNAILSRGTDDDPNADAQLQISTFTDKNCGTATLMNQEVFYNQQIMQQTRSYSLSRDLGEDEVFNVYANAGWRPTAPNPINPALNGQAAACAQFVFAMTPSFRTQGCHTFVTNMGCLEFTI